MCIRDSINSVNLLLLLISFSEHICVIFLLCLRYFTGSNLDFKYGSMSSKNPHSNGSGTVLFLPDFPHNLWFPNSCLWSYKSNAVMLMLGT